MLITASVFQILVSRALYRQTSSCKLAPCESFLTNKGPHVSHRRTFASRRTVTSRSPAGNEPIVPVFGGTPASITAAVRAVQDGAETTLVSRRDYLGGMLTNNVYVFETLYHSVSRSPLLGEYLAGVRDHYRERYGADSAQDAGYDDGYLHESHVANAVLTAMADRWASPRSARSSATAPTVTTPSRGTAAVIILRLLCRAGV
ncbi:FAD-dependent oxidoreductase [Haloprofundus halobius]|uniref:FAD-dependent oxidoreductase n=1 Tax=Haloprofundus halobius TaxID=2876194 RepID=UPI001CCAB7FB|nr:FAD-dependent oxidoreductase [Haloprofundus halobius]